MYRFCVFFAIYKLNDAFIFGPDALRNRDTLHFVPDESELNFFHKLLKNDEVCLTHDGGVGDRIGQQLSKGIFAL